MTPRRRAADAQPFVLRYWPIIVVLLGWAIAGIVGYVHLEDHFQALERRADFHWGREW